MLLLGWSRAWVGKLFCRGRASLTLGRIQMTEKVF